MSVFLLFLLISACTVHCTKRSLLNHALTNYSKYEVPSSNLNQSTTVCCAICVKSIESVDEEKGEVVVGFRLQLRWTDHMLNIWSPQKWDGVEIFNVPTQLLWTPDVSVVHIASWVQKSNEIGRWAVVHHNGTVMLQTAFRAGIRVLQSQMKSFPFDKQKLRVLVGSQSMLTSSLEGMGQMLHYYFIYFKESKMFKAVRLT